MSFRRTLATATMLGLFASGFAPAVAATEAPTFNRDVLPILQSACQDCHRPKAINVSGMVAPFALTNYADARPWAKSIAKAVESRQMPPWFASDEFHGVFRNERRLSDTEIDTIVRWARNGALAGDAAEAPAPRTDLEADWWLGEPDLIVPLPEPVWVGDDVEDWQPNYYVELTPEMLPEDRYLRSIECRPDGSSVHHVVVYSMDQGTELSRGNQGKHIGGLAPGAEPTLHHDGFGVLLEKGSTLRINMHYHKEGGAGTGEWDQTELGLFFYPQERIVREVITDMVAEHGFEIPAREPAWNVDAVRTFERPIDVFGYLPHMHLRGVAARYSAVFPDGRREELLDVPRYDYNWQTFYAYPEPRRFPAGTRVEVRMTFDNSEANPSNPDPDKAVRFGLETTDEMALGWIRYSYADEPAGGATGGGR